MKKRLVVLTGAGISAESGLATFRAAGGLWEGHKIEDVASPEGWRRNKTMVLDFYNQRRKAALEAKPNAGHLALVELEKDFEVCIITQNVDNLHEKAGSSNIVHLHGELFKSRSTLDPRLVYEMDGWELKEGDTCERGSQLRPHIVWFGEAVPMMDRAISIAQNAHILMVVGTSLQVYPAASLVEYVQIGCPLFLIDPNAGSLPSSDKFHLFAEPASTGVKKAADEIRKLYL
jgi:NAD-dependent deacetylase